MGSTSGNVVPFTLDDRDRLEHKRIHLLLIDDARRGFADIAANRDEYSQSASIGVMPTCNDNDVTLCYLAAWRVPSRG
jgi:hypothetical protein